MSRYGTGPGPECGRYAAELAELALGIATGRERAETLAHVEQCQNCQAEMERLSLTADSLLEVLPGIEPPIGFEVRLAEALRVGARRRTGITVLGLNLPKPRLSLALASVLALVVLGAGVGAGWLARGNGSQASAQPWFGTAPGGSVLTSSLVSKGSDIGSVTLYSPGRAGAAGREGWVFMSLDVGSWSGEASCELRLGDGRRIVLGTFWLDHGYGAWGVGIPLGTGPIAGASVLGTHGVLASAAFASNAPAAARSGGAYSGASGT